MLQTYTLMLPLTGGLVRPGSSSRCKRASQMRRQRIYSQRVQLACTVESEECSQRELPSATRLVGGLDQLLGSERGRPGQALLNRMDFEARAHSCKIARYASLKWVGISPHLCTYQIPVVNDVIHVQFGPQRLPRAQYWPNSGTCASQHFLFFDNRWKIKSRKTRFARRPPLSRLRRRFAPLRGTQRRCAALRAAPPGRYAPRALRAQAFWEHEKNAVIS